MGAKAKFFKPKLLDRKRIYNMLEGIFDVPLFLLISSMGYGKTTAVKDFLAQRNISYSWFSVNSYENDELWLWQKFCQSLTSADPELSGRLADYGLPQTAPQ